MATTLHNHEGDTPGYRQPPNNIEAEMGLLGAYNKNLGIAPFERFYVGGDGSPHEPQSHLFNQTLKAIRK